MTLFLTTKKRLQQRSRASWRQHRSSSSSSSKSWKKRLYEQRCRTVTAVTGNTSKIKKKLLVLDAVTMAVLRHAVEQFLLQEQNDKGAGVTVTVQSLAQALGSDVHLLDIYAEQQEQFVIEKEEDETSVEQRYSILRHCYRRHRHRHRTLDPSVQRKYDLLHQLQLLQQTETERTQLIRFWSDARNVLTTLFEFPVEQQQQDDDDDDDENKDAVNRHSKTKDADDAILQSFQKRLHDIHLETDRSSDAIGLRPSQHAWQEILAESSIFLQTQRQQQEKLRLQEEQAKQQKRLEQEAAAQREREAQAQAVAEQYLRPLSPSQIQRLTAEMNNHSNPDQIIAQYEQDTCSRRSLQTLMPGTWLNDEVIHYYLTLLALRDQTWCAAQQQQSSSSSQTTTAPTTKRRRSHFFKSFFMTKLCNDYDVHNPGVYSYANVKRWSKKVPGACGCDVCVCVRALALCASLLSLWKVWSGCGCRV